MITNSKPEFITAASEDGRLQCRWLPFESARAWLIVSLRSAESFDADQFWSGAIDSDLIRFPVDSAAGVGTAYVPAQRGVALALVARDGAQARLPTPDLHLINTAAAAEVSPNRHLEAPVLHAAHDGHAGLAEAPFVFVQTPGAQPSPDLGALARRVARVVQGSAASSEVGRKPQLAAAFGTRQKWYLTRLAWKDATEGPRVAVVRDHYVDGSALLRWSHTLPDDAIPLPDGADGIIDGRSEDDKTHFYAVMQGPAPWRALVVAPVPPPFDDVCQPFAIGEAEARLESAIDARLHSIDHHPMPLKDLPVVLSALRGAVAWLAPDSPLQQRVLDTTDRIANEKAF